MALVTKSTYLRGPKGDIGLQGPKGDRGLPGPQGRQGIQGPDADPQYIRGQISASGNITYDLNTGKIGFTDPGYATINYVDSIITNLIGNAPSALDTLKEIADAINNDADFYNSKLSIAGGTMTGALILNANPTNDLGAATKQYVDNATSSIVTSYNDLTDKPELFSGSYTDLVNKPIIPTVPTALSSFTNDSGFITSSELNGYATEAWVNSQNFGNGNTTLPANAVGYLVNDGFGNLSWASGDGTFSGNYNDLINKPVVPYDISQLSDVNGLLTSGSGAGASNWDNINFNGGTYDDIETENFDNSTYQLHGENIDSPVVVVAPLASNSPGELGQIAYDNDYVYVCIATNTWKRSALSSW